MSIKFRDFDRKVKLECNKFRDFFSTLQFQNCNNIIDMIAIVNNRKQNELNITKQKVFHSLNRSYQHRTVVRARVM